MPNSETLMQVWPADMERLLRSPESLLSNLDCTLEEYTDIICGIPRSHVTCCSFLGHENLFHRIFSSVEFCFPALFGIPIYDSRIEALHQLFTLFVDFKEIST